MAVMMFLIIYTYFYLAILTVPGYALSGATFAPFRLPTVLPSNFALAFPAAVHNISDPVATYGRNLAIPLPTFDLLNITGDYYTSAAQFMKSSLPGILAQFGIPADQIADKTAQGIPVLVDALHTFTPGSPGKLNAKRSLNPDHVRRGLGSIFGDIACGIAAAIVGPIAFLYSATVFAAENDGNDVGLSDDQQFFVYPVHGDIATSAPVKIYYRATRSVGFARDEVIGTTFNKKFYTYLGNAATRNDPRFVFMTKNVLLHEFAHVLQYKRYNYDLVAYGDKYAFELCKDGYNNMFLENEARSKENAADQLLLDQRGRQFFDVWSGNNLVGRLGFPTATIYTTVSGDPRGLIIELSFQRGLIQIISDTSFRTFTNSEISARGKATCSPNAKCHNRREAKPLPPISVGAPDICIPSEQEERNKLCVEFRKTWTDLNARPFSPFKASVLPGCPASCQILPKVPATAHSCQGDNPAPACDPEFVEENNSKCRAARARCA
ncbi:MAG: hypothetical protein M1814_001036 [Vezdaea aestivalis]|nr:MAG: hypothetical protein M1814_001036 [Vezdaea aestivalis]